MNSLLTISNISPVPIILSVSMMVAMMPRGSPSKCTHVSTTIALCHRFLRPTLVRFLITILIFPAYMVFVSFRFVQPGVVTRLPYLATRRGCAQMLARGKAHRHERDALARRQLNGFFVFEREAVAHTVCDGASAALSCRQEFVGVLPGLKAAVWRSGRPGGIPVVLLHGSSTSSCMYRDVSACLLTVRGHSRVLILRGHRQAVRTLQAQNFDVYALDWIGYGRSDKPLKNGLVSFELHMRTLICLFQTYQLRRAHVHGYDWGG